ncbi:prepilin-type N-terminal cleavage/methylation domain-containing protein [Microcoleus sp. OTE_8_concoct_300]|uniref:prepilin-type N-terminal cleavage/methylation domain-containing protein n=1 Tax=Microcoleus sp. OTE_8_concoct_300 TaxID=2964710 RepID=UPI00403F685C
MSKQRQQQNLPQSRDSGYTIIESLVAMIVVSVLMIAIAPVMAFSVATRVQARRVELATQAARTYIDALRRGAIKRNDPIIPGFPIKDTSVARAVADAPTSSNGLYCVNFDETSGCQGNKDFFVQGVWRNLTNPPPADPTTTGYSLTVRVYRADAFSSPGSLNTTQQSVANSALGDPKAPLVVMQTEIPASTVPGSYGSLCSRIRDPNNQTGCK